MNVWLRSGYGREEPWMVGNGMMTARLEVEGCFTLTTLTTLTVLLL